MRGHASFCSAAAAGVALLFTREFSAGDKLSRQFGSTVARLIGGIQARRSGWAADVGRDSAARRRDESTRSSCGQSSRDVTTSAGHS